MKELNLYLCEVVNRNKGINGEAVINCTTRVLHHSMRYIILLFKDDDYAEEKESRMVFSRDTDQQELIRLLPGNPPKICINPFFQIYISKICFGPNVKNEDKWRPFFQYQLNNMWLKHPDVQRDSTVHPQDKYKIKSSEKHYLTLGDNK